ncbi:Laccase [Blattella germanica]|nr:Laccase [Blattella germanica]
MFSIDIFLSQMWPKIAIFTFMATIEVICSQSAQENAELVRTAPAKIVCYGDKIVVDVINEMLAKSTTIHWHGIFQKGTQYQDGVPMISQCPVLGSTTHRYSFYANQPGTFYWHSHDGTQKIDGLQGSLIIRRPKENEPHAAHYDLDDPSHVIFIADWYHSDSLQHFPGLTNPPDPALDATYFLINGRGRYKDEKTGNMSNAPYTKFVVKKGFKYRFRLIGATCTHCFTRFSIEGHRLKIIATDANTINPVEVDYLDIYTGERFDFVLNASQEIKQYRILVVGMGQPCRDSGIYQSAILHYEGASQEDSLTDLSVSPDINFKGVALNPVNSTCSGSGICVAQLEALENFNQTVLRPEPNVTYTMEFGYYYPSTEEEFERNTFMRYTHPEPTSPNVIFWINNISAITPASPLLSQREDIPSSIYCKNGSNNVPECKTDLCHCLHILRVPLGSLAQFILIDKCYWLFHCHFVKHHVAGMSLVVQVGEPEDLPPVPKGFPKCGNYLPVD